jgi:hypothetical protein
MSIKTISSNYFSQHSIVSLNLIDGNPNSVTYSSLHTFINSGNFFDVNIISIQKTSTNKYLVIFEEQPVYSSSNPVINYRIVQYNSSFVAEYSLFISSPLVVNPNLVAYGNFLYFSVQPNIFYRISYIQGTGFVYSIFETAPMSFFQAIIQNTECLNIDFNTLIQTAPTRTATPTPTPTRQFGVIRKIFNYPAAGRVGCGCNDTTQTCTSVNENGPDLNMVLTSVYMLPGTYPCTLGAFMYTDQNLTTLFEPEGRNFTYRTAGTLGPGCSGNNAIPTIGEYCFRQDPIKGIQLLCGGLSQTVNPVNFIGSETCLFNCNDSLVQNENIQTPFYDCYLLEANSGSVSTSVDTNISCVNNPSYPNFNIVTYPGSKLLGENGSFIHQINFVCPFDPFDPEQLVGPEKLLFTLTKTGPGDENFVFQVLTGNSTSQGFLTSGIVISEVGSCYTTINGNEIISGAGAPTSGGGIKFLLTLTNPNFSYSLPMMGFIVSGDGGGNGSYFNLCTIDEDIYY